MEDERFTIRTEVTEPVDALLYVDVDDTLYVSIDSSDGGIRIASSREFRVGEKISLVYDTDEDGFVEGNGSIRWTDAEANGRFVAGVRFEQPPDTGDPPARRSERGETVALGEGEKRAQPRARHSTKVYTGATRVALSNLSENGCARASDVAYDPGSFVAILFSPSRDDRVKIHGKIKWSRPVESGRSYHGVEIWHINESCRHLYDSFIAGE